MLEPLKAAILMQRPVPPPQQQPPTLLLPPARQRGQHLWKRPGKRLPTRQGPLSLLQSALKGKFINNLARTNAYLASPRAQSKGRPEI